MINPETDGRCANCFDGNGCKEGCEYWFMVDLKEAGFGGIIIGSEGKMVRL